MPKIWNIKRVRSRFIIKTNDTTYLVETKSDKDLYEQTVLLKAKLLILGA